MTEMVDRDHGALSAETIIHALARIDIGDLYKINVDGKWVYLRKITKREYDTA